LREEPKWALLQNTIRNNGKWDEVSEVSTAKLGEALRAKEWTKPLLAEIEEYVYTHTRTTLRVLSTAMRRDSEEG
ncbi:MAG: hypothetical protein ACRD2O_04650, partial [Terriglobia bacterium]